MLTVENLEVAYRTPGQMVPANRGISFKLIENEIVGLIGESGSGKTTVARALLRLLPPGSHVGGHAWFQGDDLLAMRSREFQRLRWRQLALIPQNALSALDPGMRAGDQIVEAMTVHGVGEQAARQRAAELLIAVGLQPGHLANYPHQLSGGMRQRVCFAMAMALQPAIVIADEPTTALDVLVQRDIIELILRLKQDLQMSMIYITHDLGVAAAICDRLVVIYDGRVVESGPTTILLEVPAHPYTIGLINSYPSAENLHPISIPGAPPQPGEELSGCSFTPRCPFSTDRCPAQLPDLLPVSANHVARCHYFDQAAEFRKLAQQRGTWERPLDQVR